ncbi:unnamed protein product [Commensalibacter communis]|uniref:hypothetical protein n=1 Tax=Commensalibacter communis TaxID=2972786 RepID=UPI0022FFC0BE|nr:hypothetical protein [Commensalibacter communis]CAI3942186.1 unnamed protein product [Commensalibacter communis]
MGNKLIRQLEQNLPAEIAIPHEMKMLYQWIEDHNLFIDTDTHRIGFLYPDDELKANWTDTKRDGGTCVEFCASLNESAPCWFGFNNLNDQNHQEKIKEIQQRLYIFGQTGAEGSQCAFWLNDKAELKIVHMGSGSGSILCCVLAENALDFLRLLAIGYDEICWDEEFPYPPNIYNPIFFVSPNIAFQDWVKTTFNTGIPKIALEIVKRPTRMGDEPSQDEFYNWCNQYTNWY